MEKLVRRLQHDHPNLVFTIGEAHCWSPEHSQILYTPRDTEANIAGLLHELGHARLGHRNFSSDIDLLQKEVDAWQEAARIATQYGISISDEHVQDCLDTYRDWLFRRSKCPRCAGTGIQQTSRHYHCINCGAAWEVSSSRLRRPYRLRSASTQK